MRIRDAVFGYTVVLGYFNCAPAGEALGPPVLQEATSIRLPVDSETLRRQYEALAAMPNVDVAYASTGAVKMLRGNTNIFISPDARQLRAGESARSILESLKDILLANGSEVLTVRLNDSNARGSRNIHLDQSIRGIPVLHGSMVLNVNESTGLLEELGTTFLPDRGLPQVPKLSEREAAAIAVRFVKLQNEDTAANTTAAQSTLAYYPGFLSDSSISLVWVVEVSFNSTDGSAHATAVWIDSQSGSYVGSEPLSLSLLTRTTYTANGGSPTPANFPNGLTQLTQGQVAGDPVASNAYNNAAVVYNAWQAVFQQDSLPLGVVINYHFGDPNSGYMRRGGVEYLYFDHADTRPIWNSMPVGNSVDAVAHEYGHGLNQTLAHLYDGDDVNDPYWEAHPAALNEAFADFSAVVVDVHARGGTPSPPTWQIAEIFLDLPSLGVRSLDHPLLANGKFTVNQRDWFPDRSMLRANLSRHANSTTRDKKWALGGSHPATA